MNEMGAGVIGMGLALGLGTIAIAMVWTFLPVLAELKEIGGALRDIAEAIRGDDDEGPTDPSEPLPPSSSK